MVRERINGKLSPRKINVSLAHHIDIKGFDAEQPIFESSYRDAVASCLLFAWGRKYYVVGPVLRNNLEIHVI